jgi:hypothetical protein
MKKSIIITTLIFLLISTTALAVWRVDDVDRERCDRVGKKIGLTLVPFDAVSYNAATEIMCVEPSTHRIVTATRAVYLYD